MTVVGELLVCSDPKHYMKTLQDTLARPEVEARWDVAVLDMPPAMDPATLMGLVATSAGVVIPMPIEAAAWEQACDLANLIAQIRSLPGLAPKLGILGVLPTFYDNHATTFGDEFKGYVRGQLAKMGIPVFDPVPYTVRVKESVYLHRPVISYTRGQASAAYRSLTARLDALVSPEAAA